MKFILIFLLCAFVVLLCYYSVSLYRKVQVSGELIRKAEPFAINSEDHTVTVLVLGDSTAVGVGAEHASESVPGRFASHVGATYVENLSVSGARTADLIEQKTHVSRTSYTYILVQIGGNDIIRFKSAQKSAEELENALREMPDTDHLLVLSAGNVGAAQFFPWFIRPLHTRLNRIYHELFTSVTEKSGGTYINLYSEPSKDPFVLYPERYLADDGLHPSSDGYAIWFERLLETVSEK